jgi:hypothetical protein
MAKAARRMRHITDKMWYLSRKLSMTPYLSFLSAKKIFETRRNPAKRLPPITHKAAMIYPNLPVNMVD